MGHMAGQAKDPGFSNVIYITGGDFRNRESGCFPYPVVIVRFNAAAYAHINRVAVVLSRFMTGNAEAAHARDVDIVPVQRICYAIYFNLLAANILLEITVIMVIMRVMTVQTVIHLVAEVIERASSQGDVVVQTIGRV